MDAAVSIVDIFGRGGALGLILLAGLVVFGTPMALMAMLGRAAWRAGERMIEAQRLQVERILQEHKAERQQEGQQWRSVATGQSQAIDNLADAVRALQGHIEMVPQESRRVVVRANGGRSRAA